ncbi:hypothetical protein BCR34DRAFT_71047 [Clohesyomyces aquaticus]|uniref:Uncharacterized protein n=1 Tax=Clohesyomyces aquaticus TaxID=1231657 RepID=A0A1Y1Z026_9PLEO|nr:hypothetical protein BCR34DRAFT_71047 [Clohesyomyces aquaticus]
MDIDQHLEAALQNAVLAAAHAATNAQQQQQPGYLQQPANQQGHYTHVAEPQGPSMHLDLSNGPEPQQSTVPQAPAPTQERGYGPGQKQPRGRPSLKNRILYNLGPEKHKDPSRVQNPSSTPKRPPGRQQKVEPVTPAPAPPQDEPSNFARPPTPAADRPSILAKHQTFPPEYEQEELPDFWAFVKEEISSLVFAAPEVEEQPKTPVPRARIDSAALEAFGDGIRLYPTPESQPAERDWDSWIDFTGCPETWQVGPPQREAKILSPVEYQALHARVRALL